MDRGSIEYIVGCMATYNGEKEIQRIQTGHRLKLVEFWNIRKGDRVLEIGCGQGDTTAALAYKVGNQGFVHGIDIAQADYGGPITLGEARNQLLDSDMGDRMKIEFGVDVLSDEIDFPPMSFDYIVFSHCAFYLRSEEELTVILSKVQKWGKQLCFAEWDTRIQRLEQYPHLQAVLIQAHYECFKESSLANVRTLFTPADCLRIAKDAGWTVAREQIIQSPDLQDGQWEVAMTLKEYEGEINRLEVVPDKLRSLLHSEVELLKAAKEKVVIEPLSVFAFVAE
ncbi:methyltransferase domain-containing protein [Sporosarcina thermotolerans]|uniref:Methyltransferase domain-containing protein n=2 Tax=Sporosarcina thermotolerans TaxID=633404 RepID=A0AAW9A9H4_9BACL|nr:methyltransferase domain-containing protein [Sporosarcina thermotolerans]MDW0116560.1 methyltransferase domain-containing protein [Sporosarcina thermotolerans]